MTILLDPRSGKPELDERFHYRDYQHGKETIKNVLDWYHSQGRIPDSVMENLEKAGRYPRASGPRATKQGFNEVLAVDIADGSQVLNTTTETILTSDYTFGAYDPHLYQGATWRNTLYFDASTVVTTPGTITLRQRWGGVSGTVLAASGAFAPSTAATSNAAGWVEYASTVRSIGSSGSIYTMGRMWINNLDPTSATTLKNNLNMFALPPNGTAPAVVSSLDFTTSKALSSSVQFSVTTATTQATNHLRMLEMLN